VEKEEVEEKILPKQVDKTKARLMRLLKKLKN
jgi:hypothetical protein